MIKVITYGTYDLLHYGHLRLLERAKKLGDYLIVGITSDSYDQNRGKINVQQTLTERIAAVKATGLADQIIVEEYEGQKIDDIKRYGVDIFTVGSDWEGKFDYLNDYCKVIYLDRTEGISSTKIRSENNEISMGLVCHASISDFMNRFYAEDKFVNGIVIDGICTNNINNFSDSIKKLKIITNDYEELLKHVKYVYINTPVQEHYNQIKLALENDVHVLCDSPICENVEQYEELLKIAKDKNLVLMDAIRTAYSTAYSRLLLLVKSGNIGKVLSVDTTCTNMKNLVEKGHADSFLDWGPNAMLPIFQILGTDYENYDITTVLNTNKEDIFTKIDFKYKNAVASIKVAECAKSEGELIITGTEGYIYVPAPWWLTDYFEIRRENFDNNKRYFYQLDGEGIRFELLAFTRAISDNKKKNFYIDENISKEICNMVEKYKKNEKFITIE